MNRAIAAIPLAALALAGCASTGSTAATQAAAVRAPASCESQAVSWRDDGGLSNTEALTSDMGDVRAAAESLATAADDGGSIAGPESSLQSDAATFQSDAQSGEADPPPSCIPGARRPDLRALTYFSRAAGDVQDAVSELGSGSYSVATGDVGAAGRAMGSGDKALDSAGRALKVFNARRS